MNSPDIQRLLAPVLRAARTPAQHEAIAGELERIAAIVRATGQALRREQARPPARRVSGGKGGRPSVPWVQIQRRDRAKARADELIIWLSTSLYYQAGSPERLSVQRVAGELLLTPARGDAGYKVMVNAGGIRVNASGSRDVVDLEDGKYHAELRGGAIVVGGRLDDTD